MAGQARPKIKIIPRGDPRRECCDGNYPDECWNEVMFFCPTVDQWYFFQHLYTAMNNANYCAENCVWPWPGDGGGDA
jgi:hypothetical protein